MTGNVYQTTVTAQKTLSTSDGMCNCFYWHNDISKQNRVEFISIVDSVANL